MIPSVGQVFQTNFSAQDTNVLKRFVVLVLESALLQWFQGALILFFGVALVVSLVMDNFFADLAGDPLFSSRFQQVSLLVGFMYFIWVNRNITGSVDAIKHFRSLLDIAKDIAVIFSAVRDAEEDDAGSAEDYDRKRKLLNYLIYLIDDMVRPGGSVLEPKAFELPADYDQRINLLGVTGNVFRRFDLAVSCLVEHVPKGPRAQLLSGNIQALLQRADAIENSRTVREPIVFEVSVVLFLIFWWLVYTPASMWVQFGTIHTLWTFPLVLSIIAAPGIFRMWIGSPWNSERPLRIAEHDRWPKDYVDFINILFQPRDKQSSDLLRNFEPLRTDVLGLGQ